DSVRKDLAVLAVDVHPYDSHHAGLVIKIQFFLRRDVEWVAKRDIELVVRPDAASTCAVVEAFFFHRHEFALWNDDARSNDRPFIEELGRRKHEYTIVLDAVQEAIARET